MKPDFLTWNSSLNVIRHHLGWWFHSEKYVNSNVKRVSQWYWSDCESSAYGGCHYLSFALLQCPIMLTECQKIPHTLLVWLAHIQSATHSYAVKCAAQWKWWWPSCSTAEGRSQYSCCVTIKGSCSGQGWLVGSSPYKLHKHGMCMGALKRVRVRKWEQCQRREWKRMHSTVCDVCKRMAHSTEQTAIWVLVSFTQRGARWHGERWARTERANHQRERE